MKIVKQIVKNAESATLANQYQWLYTQRKQLISI